jgi:hypothetical protein
VTPPKKSGGSGKKRSKSPKKGKRTPKKGKGKGKGSPGKGKASSGSRSRTRPERTSRGDGTAANGDRHSAAVEKATRPPPIELHVEGMPTREGEHRLIVASLLGNLVEVDQPPVVISQLPRSGGALLHRLLDGHPDCHVLPVQFDVHGLADLERIDGDVPEDLELLGAARLEDLMKVGYRQPKPKLHGDRDTYPILIPPQVLRSLLEHLTAGLGDHTWDRRMLARYATGFFNSWLDYSDLRGSVQKTWLVVRAPNVISLASDPHPFCTLYPDGRVLSVLRDPWTWYASARRWGARWRDLDAAMKSWVRAARAARSWKVELGDSAKVIAFEDLLLDPDKTMRAVARFLKIGDAPSLRAPTLNGMPIRPASSFAESEAGISTDPLQRHAELDPKEVARIEKRAGKFYREVRRLAGRVPAAELAEPGPGRKLGSGSAAEVAKA